MKTEGRNAVVELLKTDKNIDKILLEKGYSVCSTAFMVGYKDEFNFSKAFKSLFNTSPSNYKKSDKKTTL